MLLVTLLVESVTEVKTTPAVMLLVSDAGGVYVTLEPVCTVEAESEPQPAQFSATVALPEPESLVIVGVREIVAPPAVVLVLDGATVIPKTGAEVIVIVDTATLVPSVTLRAVRLTVGEAPGTIDGAV